MDGLVEPDDGHTNDPDSLNQRGDRVCDRGGRRQDDKGYDILREVHRSICDEMVSERKWVRLSLGMARIGLLILCSQKSWKVGETPYWDHQDKGHTGRVE